MTQPLGEYEYDMPAPDVVPELVDGTGENYGWPAFADPDEGQADDGAIA
jgi:hypothetical protein